REGVVEGVDAAGVAEREAEDPARHGDRERRGEVGAELALAGGRDRVGEAGGGPGDGGAEELGRLAHPERTLERRPYARVLVGVRGEHHAAERGPHQVLLRLDGGRRPRAERL